MTPVRLEPPALRSRVKHSTTESCEWGDLAISESPLCRKPLIKFLFKRIYGLEEDVG